MSAVLFGFGLIGYGVLHEREPNPMAADSPGPVDDDPFEQDDLRLRLELLQAQWRRLESLLLAQPDNQHSAAAMTPAVALALQPIGALSNEELQRRLSVLTTALGERLAELKELKRQGVQRLLPVAGIQPTSDFGLRIDPVSGKLAMHNGIDFKAPIGTAILAMEAGKVKSAGLTPQFGWTVELEHANGLTTRYAHALRLLVFKGQQVAEGQKIAEVGSSGKSTGAHLHFEVRYNGVPVNPRRFLALR
ncbi:murein DD-endopeptidase MepM/ murein hydrolase activator NlpD [Chitinivorax tropicus]|uniref:Murein DD-endopeptidase MepM/ murein hydrolase activator NlpD n=1 Tax=Chitinivorax tropicus TaxID=714531 RepID=A0A840MM61_9PROT|nr:M23 family metallopeptidase [Chitinivorax tropicus]MBB5018007.1 murein DD-endopeptidase MepM/ murein hydrolase activator NlpD [Chitinivorax tropicus]